MQRLAIFIVAIAYFSYKFLPPLTANNALVLVETKGLYIEELPKVQGLKAAFRVLQNFDDLILQDDKKERIERRNKWNLIMVFEHYAKGDFPLEKLDENLREKKFVKDFEIIPFTSKPLYAQAINSYFSIKAYLGSVFPSVFGGKLTKITFNEESMSALDKKLTKQCKGKSHTDQDKPVIMVNINRNNKTNTDNETYGKHVLMNIFPLIGSRIYMMGKPESDYWDLIGLVRYQSEGKLCEMVLSDEYAKVKPLKKSGLDDSYTSLTATALAYQKDLVE